MAMTTHRSASSGHERRRRRGCRQVGLAHSSGDERGALHDRLRQRPQHVLRRPAPVDAEESVGLSGAAAAVFRGGAALRAVVAAVLRLVVVLLRREQVRAAAAAAAAATACWLPLLSSLGTNKVLRLRKESRADSASGRARAASVPR